MLFLKDDNTTTTINTENPTNTLLLSSSNNNSGDNYDLSILLVQIFDFLSVSLEKTFYYHTATSDSSIIPSLNLYNTIEDGLDIIYIDQYEYITKISTSSSSNAKLIKHDATTTKMKKKKNNMIQQNQNQLFLNNENYNTLSTILPYCVIVALEDIFLEISLSSSSNNITSINEMCTFLPCQKWVFGRWRHCVSTNNDNVLGHEKNQRRRKNYYRILLLICDAHRFVTLSDVQRIIVRVKKDMLNNVLI